MSVMSRYLRIDSLSKLNNFASLKGALTGTGGLNFSVSQHRRRLDDGDLRNDKFVIHSDVPPMNLPNKDLCSAYFPRWAAFGEAEALECTSTGEVLTYNDLLDVSFRWSALLDKLKKKLRVNRCRVALLAPNVVEYVPIVFGTMANGCTITTVNTNYKAGEIAYQLSDSMPSILVVDSQFELVADEALREMKHEVMVLTIGASSKGRRNIKHVLYDKGAPKSDNFAEVDPFGEATILYSSGTTGRPKGVVTSHAALTNNVLSYTHPYFNPVQSRQTLLCAMPAYHAFGFFIILLTNLYHGHKIAMIRSFDSQTYGSVIKKHQILTLHMVPTLMNFVINSPMVTREDLASVERAVVGGAPVAHSAATAFREKAPGDIHFQEGYGMTEAFITHMSPRDSIKIGFCGKLFPNIRAKIVDTETGEPVGRNQRGELLLHSTGAMNCYLNNPTATAETLDSAGWVHSGDVAVCSDDGYFKIVDRIKELIKVKGFQVSPAEVEDIILEHPAVAEAGVVGVPDEKLGEKVRAYVTLKAKLDNQELIDHVASKLAHYKQLTGGVRVIQEMPKTQTGKILRKDLREMVKNEEGL